MRWKEEENRRGRGGGGGGGQQGRQVGGNKGGEMVTASCKPSHVGGVVACAPAGHPLLQQVLFAVCDEHCSVRCRRHAPALHQHRTVAAVAAAAITADAVAAAAAAIAMREPPQQLTICREAQHPLPITNKHYRWFAADGNAARLLQHAAAPLSKQGAIPRQHHYPLPV